MICLPRRGNTVDLLYLVVRVPHMSWIPLVTPFFKHMSEAYPNISLEGCISAEIHSGWEATVAKLWHDLSTYRGERVLHVAQIKEKFGDLCIHLDKPQPLELTHILISAAEEGVRTVCNICGGTPDGTTAGLAGCYTRCGKCKIAHYRYPSKVHKDNVAFLTYLSQFQQVTGAHLARFSRWDKDRELTAKTLLEAGRITQTGVIQTPSGYAYDVRYRINHGEIEEEALAA